jgi:hypothetical protein
LALSFLTSYFLFKTTLMGYPEPLLPPVNQSSFSLSIKLGLSSFAPPSLSAACPVSQSGRCLPTVTSVQVGRRRVRLGKDGKKKSRLIIKRKTPIFYRGLFIEYQLSCFSYPTSRNAASFSRRSFLSFAIFKKARRTSAIRALPCSAASS